MIRLGVNIDHVATLRQARGGRVPDLLGAAHAVALGGADHVVVHLREDRRHVQDRDVRRLVEAATIPVSLEMAATPEMVAFAKTVKPAGVCLVPEKREEKTTEGGLPLSREETLRATAEAVAELGAAGIAVSLFVDPEEAALVAASGCEARAVELHTGRYADAVGEEARVAAFQALARSAASAKALGMRVHAGHGLDERNVSRVAAMPEVEELNIGFSIVAKALFVGLTAATATLRDRIDRAREAEGRS